MRTNYGLVVGIFVLTVSFASAQDAVKLSPSMYKVLLENEHVRVLEFRCKPGEKEPMHSHPAFVAFPLSASKFKSTTPDGKISEGEGKPGTAVWFDGVTHSWECLGPVEERTHIVELKGPAKPDKANR
ncbi:MAG TPA: hypothetical protein VFZ49_10640 [Pyrinomonadaceae bacterium]